VPASWEAPARAVSGMTLTTVIVALVPSVCVIGAMWLVAEATLAPINWSPQMINTPLALQMLHDVPLVSTPPATIVGEANVQVVSRR
jgi:hypothetical protein